MRRACLSLCLSVSTLYHGYAGFSHARPATWNALPDHIRTVADPVKFGLKSDYISQVFNNFVDFCVLAYADFSNAPMVYVA